MSTSLVQIAEGFLEIARQEAREGYATRDERRIRDAAEKAWLAAMQAVDHAIRAHGQTLPPDARNAHAARHRFLEEIGRRDLSVKLGYFADRLHGTVFYIGEVPTRDVMNAILDEATQFVATFRAGV